ncbi:MAG: hypothetical protein JNN18_05805 [Rubrivivax sp.]|nr:hypothetical protein [Rubrivivax sp.]
MRISQRLLLLCGVSAAGLACVAGVATYAVTSIQTDLQGLTQRAAPLQIKTVELQERTERALSRLLKLSLSRTKDEAAAASKSVTDELAAIGQLREQVRTLDPSSKQEAIDFKARHDEIAKSVAQRLDGEASYRLETESARGALQRAEQAVSATRAEVQKIGVEAGQTADRAQDSGRRLANTAKQILTAQARLKEVAIIVGEVDAATNRFRLSPLKDKVRSAAEAITRLTVDPGTDDVLKDVRAVAVAMQDAILKDGTGLLALRGAALAAKPEARAEADAAYQKQRKAVLAPVDEQSTRLSTLLDNAEVLASRQRQALEAALKLRNEPGGVVVTSDEVSLRIRDMVATMRLLMLASSDKEAQAAYDELERHSKKLSADLTTMRAGLVKMGRPQLAQQVDGAITAISSVEASLGSVAAAKLALLGNETAMSATMESLKQLALRQAQLGETQVRAMAERQRTVSDGVDERVRQSLVLVIGIALVIVAATMAIGITTVRTVTQRLNAAVAVAEQVSSGHLVAVPEAAGTDETARLMNALGRMVGTLTGIVGNIRHAADSIHVGTNEISRGNEDLSVRTEQQASQLQQTAAAVEQLTGTVRHNAESARHANQLAGDASAVATRGGAIVGDVVTTMSQIERSAQQIGEIVGVIDGIAFQTNILALNAAVEAARAGEHGRGFAVVASEVRSLAHKSAEAARQVKGIVDQSVERIASGSGLVKNAGSTMTDIVTQVQRVTQLIAEIASASEQQAQSVDSVGQAVTQLDGLTQQNAALAEQGTAAAVSLRQQAEGLNAAIGAFQLAQEG